MMSNFRFTKSIIFTVISYILIVLLLINLFRLINNSSAGSVSFAGFLEYISKTPAFNGMPSLNQFTISGSWGAFDFLRNFFNFFGYILGFLRFICASLYEMLIFVFYFVGYLFV